MTFKQALQKKFGKGLLARLLLYPRIWHIFDVYVREYEKGLNQEQKLHFRRVFGER